MSQSPEKPTIQRYSEASLPTKFGTFKIIVYRDLLEPAKEHVAIVKGAIENAADVLVRVHSECLTGEVFHSQKCDCREQLDLALQRIEAAGRGALLYLRQEGRGIGLGNKIRAYALQDQGMDTVDANRAIGFEDDAREYRVASDMLRDLSVQSIVLMTNNPSKVAGLEADGIKVSRREPHSVESHSLNRDYLAVKQSRMGHLDPLSEPPKAK